MLQKPASVELVVLVCLSHSLLVLSRLKHERIHFNNALFYNLPNSYTSKFHYMKYVVLFFAIAITSCNWAKQKTKETVNKTGEAVGKAGSEFASGVIKGVEKTFTNEVKFSDELTKKV